MVNVAEALVLLLELLEFGRGGGIDKGKRAVVRGAGDFSLGGLFLAFGCPWEKITHGLQEKSEENAFSRGEVSYLDPRLLRDFPSRTRCPYPV